MLSTIINRVFPGQLDNDYKGSKIAFYIFCLLTAVTLWRSQHHIFAPDGGAQTIATIPLDRFAGGGEEAVIGLFAYWGLSQLLIGFIYLIAIIRYRSMIPLLYLLFTFEYAMRLWIGNMKPIPTEGTAPGGSINLPFMIAGIVLFTLSIYKIGIKRQSEK